MRRGSVASELPPGRVAFALCLTLAGGAPAVAGGSTCAALLEEASVALADHQLEAELSRLRLASFEKIWELVDGLREQDAIERMIWLEARHDRDAARLGLERAQLLVVRQRHLVERLRGACPAAGTEDFRKMDEPRRRYLQADCDQQAKAIDIAEVNLEFGLEWLASIRSLREGSAGTATAQDVILAELQVALEQRRLEDARARTASCRKRTAQAP